MSKCAQLELYLRVKRSRSLNVNNLSFFSFSPSLLSDQPSSPLRNDNNITHEKIVPQQTSSGMVQNVGIVSNVAKYHKMS